MVTGNLDAFRQTMEQRAGGLDGNFAGFAVHQMAGLHDRSAECLANGLVPQAYPKDRERSAESPDDIQGNPGVLGIAGTGGQDDGFGGEFTDFLQGDLIVAHHLDVRI